MIEFLKTRNVKNPIRNYMENGGIDFFIPEYSEDFREELREKNPGIIINSTGIYIPKNSAVLIPSGIKSKFNNNMALVGFNKSGIATKFGLITGACLIDSGYQGEIHIHLINTTNKQVKLDFGSKVAQFMPLYINNEPHKVYDDMPAEDFYTIKSSRNAGAFGSTGI